ncbi:Tetraspanin-8 [Asimina triloba]
MTATTSAARSVPLAVQHRHLHRRRVSDVIYLVIMFLLIVLAFCFTVFAFVVTNMGIGKAIPGQGYKECCLSHYSHWLYNMVIDNKN